MDPSDPDEAELLDLVKHYLPHRIPAVSWEDRVSGWWGGTVVGLFAFALLAGVVGGPLAGGSTAVLVLAAIVAVVLGGVEWTLRLNVKRRRARLSHDAAAGRLVPEVAEAFRAQIESYRARTLGADSEWARARAPLAQARDEANRSVAYWSERAAAGENRDEALAQMELATILEGKFADAVERIDERAAALRRFFNRCEARISRLELLNRDREEREKLARLSRRADGEIAAADEAITRIGAEFTSDALRVGSAISGLQRSQLLDSAAKLDLDELEAVAEQIAEASISGQEELRALEQSLGVST